MTITIDDPILEERVRANSKAVGETPDEFVRGAVWDKIGELAPGRRNIDLAEVYAIIERVAAMPVLDDRTPDELIGYNDHGLFD